MLLSLVLFALGVGLISLLLVLNKQLQDKFDKNLADIDLRLHDPNHSMVLDKIIIQI